MDILDLAFLALFRNNRPAAQAVRRYGVVRFRQRIRQHIAAGELAMVRIYEEPEAIRGAMVNMAQLWEFGSHRPFRCWPLTIREENQLFGHPGRMPSRRQRGEVQP